MFPNNQDATRLPIRAQLARFTRSSKEQESGAWEFGIAIVKQIGMHDVLVIIDTSGKRVRSVWNYDLVQHPIGCAIDSAKL